MPDLNLKVNFPPQVLNSDSRNEKALYRRGQANFALKNYDTALSDLRQADKVSPNNRPILNLLVQVMACNKSYNDQQKQRLSKFFREQKQCVLTNDWAKAESGYTQDILTLEWIWWNRWVFG